MPHNGVSAGGVHARSARGEVKELAVMTRDRYECVLRKRMTYASGRLVD